MYIYMYIYFPTIKRGNGNSITNGGLELEESICEIFQLITFDGTIAGARSPALHPGNSFRLAPEHWAVRISVKILDHT